MSLLVGVQVYSVRDAAEEDLYGTLKKIKEMGYDGVEFAGLYGYEVDQVKAWVEELGLTPISTHVSFKKLTNDPELLAKFAEIGCKYAAIPSIPDGYRPGSDGFPEALEFIRKYAAEAKELGMQMLYHNHDFEFTVVGGKYGLDMIYEAIPADLLQSEIDTCWVHVSGVNPSEYIRKYTGRAPIVHLKDYRGEKSEDMYELIGVEGERPKRPSNFEFRHLGGGLNDFPSILKAAEDAGATWVIVEQDQPSAGMTPLESIAASREYLKSIGC